MQSGGGEIETEVQKIYKSAKIYTKVLTFFALRALLFVRANKKK